MSIGILTCIHANNVCTGAGCLNAFYNREDKFSEYGEKDRLGAFMTCNGCKNEQPLEHEKDPGMQEKLDRLISENIKVIHVGVCSWVENENHEWYLCIRMKKICEMMENRGIRVIQGTHRSRIPVFDQADKKG